MKRTMTVADVRDARVINASEDIPAHPGIALESESCGWCGLRRARHIVHATPTCIECKEGGRKFRVKASLQRLRRAAGE